MLWECTDSGIGNCPLNRFVGPMSDQFRFYHWPVELFKKPTQPSTNHSYTDQHEIDENKS